MIGLILIHFELNLMSWLREEEIDKTTQVGWNTDESIQRPLTTKSDASV